MKALKISYGIILLCCILFLPALTLYFALEFTQTTWLSVIIFLLSVPCFGFSIDKIAEKTFPKFDMTLKKQRKLKLKKINNL